jgi:hemolysin D
MIKILIVDDQLVVREKLQAVFREQCDLVVVGTATDGDQAISQVQLLEPDVVLMDIEMPRKNGLEAAAEIRQRFPGIRMVMLTSSDDVYSVRESLRSGVSGYLMKQNIDAEMVNLIRSVQEGHVQFAPELMEKVFAYSEALAEPSDTLQLVSNNTSALEKVSGKNIIEKFDSNIPIITRLSDWSNSAREIIDGVPLPWTRGLFYCLLAFMGVALPWAALFQMDEIGTAQGRLELTGETVRREADLEGSVTVNKVLVKKGDTNRLRDAQTESARFEKLYRSGAIAEVRSKEVESLAKERDQSKIQLEANLQQAKLRYREQQNNYGSTMQQAQADIQQAHVKLKFDEFPFQTYGIINGKLKWISPNSKVVETPAGNIVNYEVKISLNQSCVKHKNECLPFRSGQPATAEIIIRKRRILDLIMDPFTKLKA